MGENYIYEAKISFFLDNKCVCHSTHFLLYVQENGVIALCSFYKHLH